MVDGHGATGGDEVIGGELSPIELACGMVWGIESTIPRLLPAPRELSARAALEDVVRRALAKPPCVVSFSGGRDSSAILALAMVVARRDDLPLPIPVTLQFPALPETEEKDWQELVLRHLRVEERSVCTIDDELDLIGPHAAALLRRNGLLWPANLHAHLPIAAQASGGSMLTGFGGDELLTAEPLCRRVNRVLTGQVRPAPRDIGRIALFYGPRPVRRYLMRKLTVRVPERPWLRPAAAAAAIDQEVSAAVHVPVDWERSLDAGWWRTRYRRVAETGLSAVGAMSNTVVVNPFTDPNVLGALGREVGRTGFASRAEAMRHLFGDLLPEPIIKRDSKAVLSGGFWTKRAAEFAEQWDGSGVDTDLVDVDTLKSLWKGIAGTDIRSASLLQSAWLFGEMTRNSTAQAPG